MGCYYTLCHNTYAVSLLFYKVYTKRENAASWNSRLEKEQILETYSGKLQKDLKLRKLVLEYIKNIGRRKHQRGATHQPRGWRARPSPWVRPLPHGPPGRLLMPILCYMVSFSLEKIRRKLSARSAAVLRRNLSVTNVGLRRSYSAGETSLREGEITTIIITIDPLIKRGPISINISQAPSPLKP